MSYPQISRKAFLNETGAIVTSKRSEGLAHLCSPRFHLVMELLGKFLALSRTPLTPLMSVLTFEIPSPFTSSPPLPLRLCDPHSGRPCKYSCSSRKLSFVGLGASGSRGRRSESRPCSFDRFVKCATAGGVGEEDIEVAEGDRERRGEVCVATVREKKRAGSEDTDFVSSSSKDSPSFPPSGTFETTPSSFSFNVRIFAEALSKSECRAKDRFPIIGSTMYLLVP